MLLLSGQDGADAHRWRRTGRRHGRRRPGVRGARSDPTRSPSPRRRRPTSRGRIRPDHGRRTGPRRARARRLHKSMDCLDPPNIIGASRGKRPACPSPPRSRQGPRPRPALLRGTGSAPRGEFRPFAQPGNGDSASTSRIPALTCPATLRSHRSAPATDGHGVSWPRVALSPKSFRPSRLRPTRRLPCLPRSSGPSRPAYTAIPAAILRASLAASRLTPLLARPIPSKCQRAYASCSGLIDG